MSYKEVLQSISYKRFFYTGWVAAAIILLTCMIAVDGERRKNIEDTSRVLQYCMERLPDHIHTSSDSDWVYKIDDNDTLGVLTYFHLNKVPLYPPDSTRMRAYE